MSHSARTDRTQSAASLSTAWSRLLMAVHLMSRPSEARARRLLLESRDSLYLCSEVSMEGDRVAARSNQDIQKRKISNHCCVLRVPRPGTNLSSTARTTDLRLTSGSALAPPTTGGLNNMGARGTGRASSRTPGGTYAAFKELTGGTYGRTCTIRKGECVGVGGGGHA